MKFEIEIDGVNAPIEDVENAIKDILYNQLDMELGADYNKFNVNVNHLNDKHNEKIVKESRKPHMWAVDFRNMNTAIHGLFYGADRKEVQSFYNNLKDLNSEEMDGYEVEDLMNAYDSIKMIDEINFSRIGRLDSGRYGIEIDDVEYWIINYVAEDLYMESTKRNNKMKCKECGTMKKINEEIDIGWDLEARRDSDIQNSRARDEQEKWEKSTEITLNGRKMSVHYAKFLVRDFLRGLNEDDPLFDIGLDLRSDLSNASPGDSFECPEIEKHLKGSFVPYYAKVAKESTKSDSKIKFKKMVKESEGGDAPRIYVGTYAKYNDGDLSGEWVDLTDFAYDYDGFVEHCREIHKDEKDPEFMIPDYEGYPSSMYHEGGLPSEEEFDKIIELSELDDSEKDAYAAYLELGYSDDSIEAFREHYYGKYEDDNTLGYESVEEFGMPQNPEMYFDYDRFGRDLMYDYHYGDPDNTDSEGNPEDPDHYYDNDGYDMGEYHNDTQVAEDYIDSLGSIEELGKETLNNYFDYEAFGRDIRLNDMTESDGYLFWNH